MRTAISAGALALALSAGITMVTATAATATARADCDSGGLLGGITGGLCRAVDTVGNVVNGLTGTVLPPAPKSDGLDAPKGTAGDGAGDPRPSPTPDTGAAATEGLLLPKVLDTVCLPLVASPECTGPSAISAPERPERTESTERTAQPSTRPRPRLSRTGGPEPAREPTAPLPTEPLRPLETRTRTADTDEPVTPQPLLVIDAEAPRVDLLWPGAAMQEFQRRMQEFQRGTPPDRRTVTPARASDTLGTMFTAALLIAAILAVRVLYTRRTGEESMPFEPLRTGRHRTA
ncbi:hypothetical protein [Streptosporangium sp. NPDC087985]|uniref:hypothetical protein n=1 Tax=Streptosporangium sp. NPDC087985 TaxID=3366196 RepID=UPI003811CAD8